MESPQAEKPIPVPDDASRPFWDAARERRLVIQRCARCGFFQYPPDLICRRCQCDDLPFVQVSGRGSVYSHAVYVRSFMAGYVAPYVLALVDLDDHPEVRMMANIIETPINSVVVGMPVEVTFEERGEWLVPQFRGLRRETM
jgi:uncharacterized protein